jgi:PAS domain S-box-containing protein
VEHYKKELAKIKKILKENPRGMTVTDIAKEININRNSVAKYLDILLISGHAEMVTFGPAKVYFPSRRIPIASMLNYTVDYILLLDKDLKILQINDNLLQLLNISREEIIDQPVQHLFTFITQIPEFEQNAQKALDGKDTTTETKIIQDFEELTIKITHIPTTFDNGEPGVTLIISDISKIRAIQEQLQQIQHQWDIMKNYVTDMISIHSNTFTIIDANKSFAEFFDTTVDNIRGKKCYELLHGLKSNITTCPCKQMLTTKKTVTAEFYEPYLGKHLSITATPLVDTKGDIIRTIHIMKTATS